MESLHGVCNDANDVSAILNVLSRTISGSDAVLSAEEIRNASNGSPGMHNHSKKVLAILNVLIREISSCDAAGSVFRPKHQNVNFK